MIQFFFCCCGNRHPRGRSTRRIVSRWVLALFLVHLAASAEAGQVLVLYSNSRLGKGDVAFDSGLRQTINANPGQPIQILSEFLDEPEFGGDRYELTMVTYLRDKYAERPLGAVLTLNDTALRFILRYRDRLFPGVPIVYTGATRSWVAFDADAPAGCRRGTRRVRLCRHRRAGAEMASSCNAFGRRDGCIETGRLGTAGASRNHSHSGPRAGRISDRAHTADATEAPSRTGKRLGGAHVRPFPGRRRSFLSAARFRRAYYGGVLRTGVYTYRDIDWVRA